MRLDIAMKKLLYALNINGHDISITETLTYNKTLDKIFKKYKINIWHKRKVLDPNNPDKRKVKNYCESIECNSCLQVIDHLSKMLNDASN